MAIWWPQHIELDRTGIYLSIIYPYDNSQIWSHFVHPSCWKSVDTWRGVPSCTQLPRAESVPSRWGKIMGTSWVGSEFSDASNQHSSNLVMYVHVYIYIHVHKAFLRLARKKTHIKYAKPPCSQLAPHRAITLRCRVTWRWNCLALHAVPTHAAFCSKPW